MMVLSLPQLFLFVLLEEYVGSLLCVCIFKTLWVTNTDIVQEKKKYPNQKTVVNAK